MPKQTEKAVKMDKINKKFKFISSIDIQDAEWYNTHN